MDEGRRLGQEELWNRSPFAIWTYGQLQLTTNK